MAKKFPGTGLKKQTYKALTTQQLNSIEVLKGSPHLPVHLQRALTEQCRRANLLAQYLRDRDLPLEPRLQQRLDNYYGEEADREVP